MKGKLNNIKKQLAFTLVELVVVIAIISLLAAIVVVAVNPGGLFLNARNAQRSSDINTLSQGLARYIAESPISGTQRSLADFAGLSNLYADAQGGLGSCPGGANGVVSNIVGSYTLDTSAGISMIDISALVNSGYLPKVPKDPQGSSLYKACIDTSNNNALVLFAPNSEKLSTLIAQSTGFSSPGGATIYNNFVNAFFASDTSSWNSAPIVGATTPAGWVIAPGNPTYSTSDFLVMKYEAKCASTSTPTVGLATNDTGYNTYADNVTPCTSANNLVVVSTPTGYPIANISQTNSISRCSATQLGSSGHLITNNEWMTIARNAEGQNSNWTLGSVGSGYLFAGHNDNSPGRALIASSNDANKAAFTDSAGTTEGLTAPTNTANGTSGNGGNQVRTLTLSNGSNMWDIAGNLWEWTNNTIQGKDQPSAAPLGFNWREFNALTTYGTLSSALVSPSNGSYNANYGVGRIYSDGTVSNTTTYGFLRGGKWV